ncbi:MAG: putative membrane protein [Candidatus Endobugula sp.]
MAIKKGKVKVQKRKMVLLYFGALIIAGDFTFAPGRYLNGLLF